MIMLDAGLPRSNAATGNLYNFTRPVSSDSGKVNGFCATFYYDQSSKIGLRIIMIAHIAVLQHYLVIL